MRMGLLKYSTDLLVSTLLFTFAMSFSLKVQSQPVTDCVPKRQGIGGPGNFDADGGRILDCTVIFNFDAQRGKPVYATFVGYEQTYKDIKTGLSSKCHKNAVIKRLSQPYPIEYGNSIKVSLREIEKVQKFGRWQKHSSKSPCTTDNYSFYWSYVVFHDDLFFASAFAHDQQSSNILAILGNAITYIARMAGRKKATGLSSLVGPASGVVQFLSGATDIKTSYSVADAVDDLSYILHKVVNGGSVKDDKLAEVTKSLKGLYDKRVISGVALLDGKSPDDRFHIGYSGRFLPSSSGPNETAIDEALHNVRNLSSKLEEDQSKAFNPFNIDAVYRRSRTQVVFVSGEHYMIWDEIKNRFTSQPVRIGSVEADPAIRFGKERSISAGLCNITKFAEDPSSQLIDADFNRCTQFTLAFKDKIDTAINLGAASTPFTTSSFEIDEGERLTALMKLTGHTVIPDTKLMFVDNEIVLPALENKRGEIYKLFPESNLSCVTAAIRWDDETIYLFNGNRYTRFKYVIEEDVDVTTTGYVAVGGMLDKIPTAYPEVNRPVFSKWPGLQQFGNVNSKVGNRDSSWRCLNLEKRYNPSTPEEALKRLTHPSDAPLWSYSGSLGENWNEPTDPSAPKVVHVSADTKIERCKRVAVADADDWVEWILARSTHVKFECPVLSQDINELLQEMDSRYPNHTSFRSARILDFQFADLPEVFKGNWFWSGIRAVEISIGLEEVRSSERKVEYPYDFVIWGRNGRATYSFKAGGFSLRKGWNTVRIPLDVNIGWTFENGVSSIRQFLFHSGDDVSSSVRISGYADLGSSKIENTRIAGIRFVNF